MPRPRHSIEVDDKVFEYLKSRAVPFVDMTPNDVLRRELLGNKPGRVVTPVAPEAPASDEKILSVPAGTPKALEQVLQVSYLVYQHGVPRSDATHYVARNYGVFFQTVLDKYCRQLGITADRFDEFLEQENLHSLKALLKRKFSSHAELIERYLGGNGRPSWGKSST